MPNSATRRAATRARAGRLRPRRRRRRGRLVERRAEQANAGDRRQAAAERRPTARSVLVMAAQPSASARRCAAPRATAPITFGEPASSRSGGSVQMTSSRSTRSTAPPPARNGSPSAKAGAGPDERAGAERRVHLVAAPGDVVGRRAAAGGGRELGGVDEHGHAALVGGVDDLVDRRQPAGDVRRAGDGEQLRLRPRLERRGHVVDGEGAAPGRTRRSAAEPSAPTAAGWRGARRRW